MSITFLIVIPDTQGKARYALSSVTSLLKQYVYKLEMWSPVLQRNSKL